MESYGKLFLALKGGQEKEYILGKELVTLGRALTNDIVLFDLKVSRRHARLICGEGRCEVEDLGSANGTWVNGVRVRRARLGPGDVIQIGNAALRFQAEEPPAEEEEVTLLEATPIDREADLARFLAEERLEMTLSDTSLPRVAIHLVSKTWEVKLTKDIVTIGHGPANDIVIDHPEVSHRHAEIQRRGEAYIIVDLDSANGTWFKGRRIKEKRLHEGDTLQIGEAKLVFKEGFEPEHLTVVGPRRAIEKELRRRPVVVVPGFMGSELWRGDELIWPNLRKFLTRPEVIRLPDKGKVEARRLIEEMILVPNLIKLEQYSRLVDYLEEGLGYRRGEDLLEFPYDWRQDNCFSALKLKKAVEAWRRDKGHDKVTIIAHSMGCLVSRYYVECLGGKEHTERLIFLGGPHYGAPKILLALLLGRGLLPFGLLGEKIREVVASLPSAYQLLPVYSCIADVDGEPINILADEVWVAEEHRPLLRGARSFWRELGEASSVPTVCIFGYGLRTITKVVIKRGRRGVWKGTQFLQERGGDSTVPQESAILRGAEIHPVQQYHGALYTDNDVKMRLKLELYQLLEQRPCFSGPAPP